MSMDKPAGHYSVFRVPFQIDADGDCTRCGLKIEPDADTLEPHECPPGFTEPAMSGSKGLKRYNGVEQDDEGAYVYHDEHIAALRRAKAEGKLEGMEEAAILVEAMPMATPYNTALSLRWVVKERREADARAAQIEGGGVMATIQLFQCDLCQREHRPGDYWWNNANGGMFTVCRDGINGVCKWDHLCPTCRSELCEAVGKVIDSRKPKK